MADEDHKERLDIIRAVEQDLGLPIGVLLDLQGPKLRIGKFADGPIRLEAGDRFRLDLEREMKGDRQRVSLPPPEIYAALEVGTSLLLDDDRIRLEVERFGPDFAETRVIVGGTLSDRNKAAREEGLASSGQAIVIAAGMPFATSGTTNLLRIAQC